MPVNLLVSNIKNGHWHLINESFKTGELFEDFKIQFDLTETEEGKLSGGLFDKDMILFDIVSVIPQSKDERAEHIVSLALQSSKNSKNIMLIECRTEFDEIGKQYLIADVHYNGTLNQGSISGRMASSSLDIPDISSSPCVVESDGGFTYIKLKNRTGEDTTIKEAVVLGDSPNVENEQIPDDYYSTEAIQQAPFQGFTYTYENPKWTACRLISPKLICNGLFDKDITETYYPGNVISNYDLITNYCHPSKKAGIFLILRKIQ